jgi:hypothetical protein
MTYRGLGTEQGTRKNQKEQHTKLVKISGSHNRRLACSAMSPRCAWVHYSAVFQSSVGYPLSMCHLSKHQLHDLQKKYIPTLMSKIGLARTHTHVLVFCPKPYGGIGCNDLRIKQGLNAIQNLIRQLLNSRVWQTTSCDISQDTTKCIGNVKITTTVPRDKSTASERPLLCTYTKVSCKTQSQSGNRVHTKTNLQKTGRRIYNGRNMFTNNSNGIG